MFTLLFVLAIVAGILALVELLWREWLIQRTAGRRLIHILVACWVAAWPWLITTEQLRLAALSMFAGIVLSRAFNLFQSIHQVKRWTLGELLFPLAILGASLLTDNRVVFAAAMLQLGLADGLAAAVGSSKHYRPYKILGQEKSYSGTAMFILVSFTITLWAVASLDARGFSLILLAAIPLLSAAAENISVFGLDDLTVPLVTVLLLGAVA